MVLTEMVYSDSDSGINTPPISSSETVKADPLTPISKPSDADITALDVSKSIIPVGGESHAHGNASGPEVEQP